MDDQPIEDLELTPKMADVVKVFLADPTKGRYGFELMRLTGQSSSYMYPTLARLEKAGWLTAGKEDIDPHAAGRPPRRIYWISGAAVTVARTRLAELSERYRPPKTAHPRLVPRGGTL
jgi:PadR family transcriptional regulator, regulatory protein PadR